MKKLDLLSIYYATGWYMTLYSSVLPFNLFLRTFDILLNEGWKVLYRVALSILYIKQNALLNCKGFEYAMEIIRNLDDF